MMPILRMLIRYSLPMLIIIVMAGALYFIVQELQSAETNEGLTALLGAVLGYLGNALQQAIRDLYATNDEENRKGKPYGAHHVA